MGDNREIIFAGLKGPRISSLATRLSESVDVSFHENSLLFFPFLFKAAEVTERVCARAWIYVCLFVCVWAKACVCVYAPVRARVLCVCVFVCARVRVCCE